MMKNYCIKENYTHRLQNDAFDDTPFKDEWQKEVYEVARKIADQNNIKTVMDIGTGSGYKLLKNFQEFDTLGVDVQPTVKWLKDTYPDRKWTDQFEPVLGYDMIIASDVIEHIPDPDLLLDLIIRCCPKIVILSTPDRDLRPASEANGPPSNASHVREWNMPEFRQYIETRLIVHNQFTTNPRQNTQIIIASLK